MIFTGIKAIKLAKILSESKDPEKEIAALRDDLNEELNEKFHYDLIILTPIEFCSLFGTGWYVKSKASMKKKLYYE